MKLFYTAYTNKGNVGDLLITKYQIEEYAKYGEIYVDCHGMPEGFKKTIFDTQSPNIIDFEKEYGLTYRSKSIFKVICFINRHSFTHFSWSPGPREPLSLPIRKLILKIAGVVIPTFFLKRGIKKLAWGVDVNCDFKGWIGFLNRWYFKQFDVIGIRSRNNCKQLKHLLKNVIYVPDMAFLYPYFYNSSHDHPKKRIGLSFRKVDDYDQLLDVLKQICSIIKERDYEVDLLYQVDEDRSFCFQLLNDLGRDKVSFTDSLIDYYALSSYNQYDIVISNRLHVLLMSAMNGALPFGLLSNNVNEQKIANIFEGVFQDNYISYIEKFTIMDLICIYDSLDSHLSYVRNEVKRQRDLCISTLKTLLQV